MKTNLFSPLTLRGLTFRNRIFMAPMCLYVAPDAMPAPWHLVHYGSRAVGGAACLIQEATGVTPEGRISTHDLGMWSDAQAEAAKPLVRFIKESGCVPGIQLGHAGRKASTAPKGGYVAPDQGGWELVAPSAIAFDAKSPTPRALKLPEIRAIVDAFATAAQRCLVAGYEVIEIHAAHGYLLHQFLSPLSNHREDEYGGSLENRMRLVLEVASAVRDVWPDHLPLFVRISATDWVEEGGWDVPQSVALCRKLKEIGVDLIDVSSGGLIPGTKIITGPGYQIPFAEAVGQSVQIPVGTVGQIVNPVQAEQIVANRQADAIFIGRELMRDPYWPLHAAVTLGEDVTWPTPYIRAKPKL